MWTFRMTFKGTLPNSPYMPTKLVDLLTRDLDLWIWPWIVNGTSTYDWYFDVGTGPRRLNGISTCDRVLYV